GMATKGGLSEALAKVPMVVALASRANETTARAHLVLPTLHPVESWGDYEVQSGIVGLQQPTMGPVPIAGKPVDAKSTGDVLLTVGRQALGTEEGKGPLKWATFEELLNEEWQKRAKDYRTPFAEFWEEAQKRGGAWGAQTAPTAISLRKDAARVAQDPLKLKGDGSHQ